MTAHIVTVDDVQETRTSVECATCPGCGGNVSVWSALQCDAAGNVVSGSYRKAVECCRCGGQLIVAVMATTAFPGWDQSPVVDVAEFISGNKGRRL